MLTPSQLLRPLRKFADYSTPYTAEQMLAAGTSIQPISPEDRKRLRKQLTMLSDLRKEQDNLQRIRDALSRMRQIADEEDIPLFAVSSGASVTRNNGDAYIKKIRDWHAQNELAMGDDPNEDWSQKKADYSDEEELPPVADYQQNVIDKMVADDNPGVLAAHGTGSGKSRTAVESIKKLGQPADIVVPAALLKNMEDEMKKWRLNNVPVSLHSLESVALGKESLEHPVLVVDEVQRLRGRGKAYNQLLKSKAKKKLLLSGTPVPNRPSDILAQLRLLTGNNMYSVPAKDFDYLMSVPDATWKNYFFDNIPAKKNIWGMNKAQLRRFRERVIKDMRKNIDIFQKTPEDMPEVKEEIVDVPMTPDQEKLERLLRSKLSPEIIRKIRQLVPPDQRERKALNSFLSNSRQLMDKYEDASGNVYTPKIDRAASDALELLKSNPRAKTVAYSNFLESGLDEYAKKLQEAGVPYGEFSGRVSRKVRNQAIEDFNKDKIRALLLSGAAKEGLSLRGSRMLQILDPSWSEAAESQIKARGIRRGSHNHLSPEERNILIRRYLSTPNNRYDISTDQYLISLQKRKLKAIDRLMEALNKEER